MKVIYKFPLSIARENFEIASLPEYAPIIHVGLDTGAQPCLWAEVFTEWVEAIEKYETEKSARKRRTFSICGTGRPCPVGEHVGSFVQGLFVWHLYETTKRA